MVSYEFARFIFALGLGAAALQGCVTAPSTTSLRQTSTATPPRAEPFSAPTIAQLRADAAAKGWVFQIDGRTTLSHNLYFARPQSLARVGNYARFVQLEIRETPLKVGNEWVLASVTTSQIDCVNRTRQILNAELYSDRAFNQRVGTFN